MVSIHFRLEFLQSLYSFQKNTPCEFISYQRLSADLLHKENAELNLSEKTLRVTRLIHHGGRRLNSVKALSP